ncbi:MAG TPA: PAS domain S-box protein [Thermodesulfobacteriota bacterium]|nr:PAS domain S-box protein [Thermodesulfobacteriota bacterium]
MEEEITTLKQQMEFILGVTKTGLDIIDSKFNIRYIDPEWAKVYGDPTGRKCYEYFMGGKAPCPSCGIPKALQTKKPIVTEEILVKENSRPIQVTTIPFQNNDGEWLVAEVNVDISERKWMEEAVRKAHGELETRIQERTAQLALANEAMQLEIIEREQVEEALRKSEEEAKRLAQENAITAKIGRIISSSLNIADVYEQFAREVHKLIPFDGIAINIINHEEGSVTVPYVAGTNIPGCQPGDAFLLDGSVTGAVAQKRSGLIIQMSDRNELQARFHTLLTAFDRGLRSVMAVPLISKDRVIGAIHFRSTKVNIYSNQDLKLAENIGSQIAGAIANAQLFAEHKGTGEILRKSEEGYRSLVESARDAIFTLSTLGTITSLNPAFERITGWSHAEWIDKPFTHILHPDDLPIATKLFQKAMHGEMLPPFELRVLFKSGEYGFGEFTATPQIEKGVVRGILGIGRDITERKRAEETLRESEERYRTILENIEDGYYEVDLPGNFTFFNDSLCRMLGYCKDEMSGMGNQQYTDQENRKKLFQAFNQVYRTGIPTKGFDWEVIRKDGAKVFGEVSVSLIKNSKGQPIGFRGIARDITERKKAEEALQESEKKFRVLTETAASGIFIHQGEKFVYVNPASEAITGYSRQELLAMDFWNIVHPDYRELVKQRAQARHHGEPVPSRYELKIITKNGEERWIDLAVGMIDFDGKPAVLGTDFDITERKRAEEEMRALEEQLRQSQKIEAIGRLAGGIAHDFNNLLTVIKGYSQLSLLDLKESDPLWGNIQEIQKATQRAADLTRHLLAFSRRQILDPKVLDLNSLLRDLDKMLRRIIGEDIGLSTQLTNDLGRVKIDPGQFEQMILNLAVNAKDAMPSGGKLMIETSNVELDEEYAVNHASVIPGHYVRLSVSDTGAGMAKDVREKIFEPFFTTKEKGKGTGLGLSTVYGIVKQSGGNIWVYSELGHGTTFKIYLPIVGEDLETLSGRDEAESLPRGSETVLLVEDELSVRELAQRLLRQQGYNVLEADNGKEALGIAQETYGGTIHLLLTDVVMPEMGGKKLADQLKIIRPALKVLYTSGYTDDAIVHHGTLDPGTHFLQKPFSPKTLLHKVREVLDR